MSLSGILLVDKPQGVSSHDVVARVRRHGQLKRVGHAGTLDPLATGVLVVGLGRATRLLEYIVGLPKTYETVVRLGETTNTYDAEGEITAVSPLPMGLNTAVLETTLAPFRGQIQQIPPAYSAIKKNGQPLYKLARQGIEVELTPRPVTIYELTLLAWEPPDLSLRIVCSAGTYIRSLGHDVGQALGCGGHLLGLRRTAVGSFTSDRAIPLSELTADNLPSWLLPPDSAVAHLPALSLLAEEWEMLGHGRVIPHQPDHPTAPLVRLYTPTGEFAGLARQDGDNWRPHKLFTADD
jgi:tRNA pseudouridine55 synthase